MLRRKSISGVIDPVSLIGVLFLIITLSVGTHVVVDKQYDFNIFEQAAKPKKTGNSAFDKCREESGREVCNERLGINVNWKGEIVNEIDTSKVDKDAPQGQPTCDANGVQYSPGAVVMYGGIGSNATCGQDGKWDVGVGATIDIKQENVPEYAKGSDKLKKQIEVEQKDAQQLATEQQTVTPQTTITTSTAEQENLDREKSQCLQEGGSWFANICSYAEQKEAIAKLTPIIQEQQEQKTQAVIQTEPTVTTETSPVIQFANITAGVSGGTITNAPKLYVPPLLPTVPTVEDLINKIPGLEKLNINDVKTLDYPSSPQEENKKIFNWPKLEGLGTYGLGGGNAYVPPVPMNIINSENSSDFYNYAIGNTVSVGAGFASATLLTPGAPVSVFETITAIPRVVQALTLSDLADTAITGALCSQGNQDACAAFTATALIPGPAGSVNLIADSIEDFATSWAGTGSTISKLLNNIPSPALFNPSSSFDSFIPTNTTTDLAQAISPISATIPVTENLTPKVFDATGNNMPKATEITIPQKFTNWVKTEMAKTNPNAFKNINVGFELRSPIGTDGKLQLPFEKTTISNIENATEMEVPKIILWDEKSLNQNNLNVNQEITRIQQEIGITNTNVVTKIDQVKILDTVPLVTNKEVDAVEAILRGGDLKSTYTLISEGIVTQGHTSQFDIDRGLDKYIFSSWGTPETFSKSRYGDYMIILDPALLKQPTTLVSSGDVANISDQLYSQSIISGADYLDTIKRITITGFDNPQQVIRGENLSLTDVTDKSSELLEIYRAWREPEVKIKGNISPDNILAIIVKNESEKIRLLELAKQNKSKIPIYTEKELFGSDWLFRPDRPFDQIGREKIAELGQNSTTSLPANQNLPSTARDQTKNTINPPQPKSTIPQKFTNWWDDTVVKPLGDLVFGKKPMIPASQTPTNSKVEDVVSKLNKLMDRVYPESPNLPECRTGLCGWVSDDVEVAFKYNEFKTTQYQVADLNATRGMVSPSFKHAITVIEDNKGNKYLIDLTFSQFINKETIKNPIAAEVFEKGYIKLDDNTLNEYLNLMTSSNVSQPKANLDILEQTKARREVQKYTPEEIKKYYPELVDQETSPPLTGISKFQEQVGSFGQKVVDGSLSTGAGLSPLKYVAGGAAATFVYLDDYYNFGIVDYIQNNFVSAINHIYSDNEQKTEGAKLDSNKLNPTKPKKVIVAIQKPPEESVQNIRPSECINKEVLDTAVVGGDTGLRYDSKFRPNVVVINDIIKGATYDTWTAAELAPEAVDPVKKWVEWINEQGYSPFISSGYRSYETQEAYSRSYGNQAATPGGSCHQSGLCFDVHFYIDNKTGKRYDLCYDPNLPECLINMNAQEKAQELGIAHPYKWDQPHYMVAVAASPAILPFVQQQPLNKTYINSLNEELLKFQNSCNYTDENRFVSNP